MKDIKGAIPSAIKILEEALDGPRTGDDFCIYAGRVKIAMRTAVDLLKSAQPQEGA